MHEAIQHCKRVATYLSSIRSCASSYRTSQVTTHLFRNQYLCKTQVSHCCREQRTTMRANQNTGTATAKPKAQKGRSVKLQKKIKTGHLFKSCFDKVASLASYEIGRSSSDSVSNLYSWNFYLRTGRNLRTLV